MKSKVNNVVNNFADLREAKDSNFLPIKKSAFNEEIEKIYNKQIKFKIENDQRKKDSFLLIIEMQLPQIFQAPLLIKNKMMTHVLPFTLLINFSMI